jgi:hypothetical protein
MVIFEIAVLGNTHLFKKYLDACTELDEPRPEINVGHLLLSPLHKINFYFIDDYNKEKIADYKIIFPYLLGYIGLFDWQDENSLLYLQELLQKHGIMGKAPVLFHALNLSGNMPFTTNRLEKGLALNKQCSLFFDPDRGNEGVKRALQGLISIMSSGKRIRNEENN